MIAPVLLVWALFAQAQTSPQAHYSRGVHLLQQRDLTQAAEEFQAALKQNPSLAEARYGLGLVRLAENDPAAALAEFRAAVKLKPSLPEAHLGLGLALGQSGDLDGAAGEFRAAIRLRPNFAEAHKRLGITLRRQGDPKSARSEFQAAVESDPRDPEAWYNLGLARKSEQDVDGAIAAFRRAISIQPDFEKARYNLGIALRAQGRQQDAKAELDEIRGLHQFREKLAESKALIVQGVDALQQSANDRALEFFTEATRESPTLPTGWHYLGVAWQRKGDNVKAMAAWKKALELQPDYPQTHTSIGLLYASAGDFERAAEEFRQTTAAAPDDAEAHYNLGLALARTGRLDEALAEFTEAVSLNPRYTAARLQSGLTLAAQNKPAAAAKVYRELIRQNPGLPEAYNNLGLALLQENDFAGARSAFESALELNPAFAPAVQNVRLTEVCKVSSPTATLEVPRVPAAGDLNADPASPLWSRAGSAEIVKDCTHLLEYPELRTEVRGFWTATDLYLLFTCPYRTLNVVMPAQNDRPRNKLWDHDVVEMFLGDDWTNIRHYREFEIAPTADWIDLAIDLDRKSYDRSWRSGWQTTARIDEQKHVWYAAARIPLRSVSAGGVEPGARWRMNLYRIEGQGPDAKRHFMCWQPTCVVNRDPNHVPENFGTLVFGR